MRARTKVKLRQFQIAFLKIYAGYRELDHALASYKPLIHNGMWDPTGYAEGQRKYAGQELQRLYQHIRYLQKVGYIERVEAGEEKLMQLTSKGKYELLRLRFVAHMMEEKKKAWDRKWRMIMFDIPEEIQRHRNFFRHLLKKNGFRMVQRSVWITPYNPQPALDDLLEYLKIKPHFEFIEADCEKCSPSLLKKFKP